MDPWVRVEVCQSFDPFLGSHVKYGPNLWGTGQRPEFGKVAISELETHWCGIA